MVCKAVPRTAGKIQKEGAERVRRMRRGRRKPSPGDRRLGISTRLSRPQPPGSGAAASLCALVHSFFIRGGVSVATFTFLAEGKTVILHSMQNAQSLLLYKVS